MAFDAAGALGAREAAQLLNQQSLGSNDPMAGALGMGGAGADRVDPAAINRIRMGHPAPRGFMAPPVDPRFNPNGTVSGFKSGGRLTAGERQSLPKSDFALPGKGKGPKGAGAGSYPIPDKSHARNALARVAQHGTSAEKERVRSKVHAKYPEIK